MEREREIRAFVPENYWVITAEFETERKDKIALVCDEQPKSEKETDRIIETARENKWQIVGVTQSEAKRYPKPPLITSTLQQTASSRFGFSPSRTMFIAQKLYEQGLITYMRTDGVNISKEALPQIYAAIEKQYGKEYLAPRTYAAKSKSAQEAHEAIRPADFSRKSAGTTDEQKKLYQLIWQRTAASQMADAKILRTKISANIDKTSKEIPNFSATGSVVIFPAGLRPTRGARRRHGTAGRFRRRSVEIAEHWRRGQTN